MLSFFFSEILRRPLAFLSVFLSFLTTLAVLLRLLPNRNARKAYHVVIILQSVLDLFDASLRVLCDSCSIFYLEMTFRYIRVISWLLTAVTAIYWMSLFFDNRWRTICSSIVLFIAALPILSIFPYFALTRTTNDLSHNENIALAWIKAVSLSVCALIVLYCLVRVLLLPNSTFTTTTTFKGYRKVATGLGLKTTSVLLVAITSAHDAIRQTATEQETPQWMFVFIDIYPGTNACVTLWMVSRFLWKQPSTVVIEMRATSETK